MRKLKNEELDRLDVTEFKDATKTKVSIVLDNIRSLNNIGSVFRTADAFLVEKIYLCGITAKPPHKDIHKTALGATDSVEWAYASDTLTLIEELKKEGKVTIAIEQAEGALLLQDYAIVADNSYVLVFGNEVKGVDQQVVATCDTVLEIPQFGTKHSLNISVSVGVVVWDFWSKLNT
ncbi:RNA methyltransferase [Maribacter antarcticus]|uniref:RNA methyltransferase n=1 Tax=Maribacter antarcticus TaxID=505250 RepID=UPI00047D78A2|nr:RNA methyltransferase [Maribacter antarcticus]